MLLLATKAIINNIFILCTVLVLFVFFLREALLFLCLKYLFLFINLFKISLLLSRV